MIDTRFYAGAGPVKASVLFPEIELRGDGALQFSGLASLDAAGPDDICFFEGKVDGPLKTKAGLVVIKRAQGAFAPEGAVLALATHPRAAFAGAARRLFAERGFQREGPPVSPEAQLETGVVIGPHVTIGPGAVLGQDVTIGPNAVIGPGVRIGRRSTIGAGAVIACALIGDDVTILPGAVIGQPGFGVAAGPTGPVDMPHFGRVIIEDRVTLGALTAVDRGLFADTIISEDAKIDNLCHIAHNVVVGRGVLIAAFGGIAGSSTLGDGAVLAGRAGVRDHVTVGAGAQIGAGAAVLTDVPAGETWSGYPAKPIRRWLREVAWLAKGAGKRDAGE